MFCAKNHFKKHQIFEKWHHFENRPSCKAYSLCEIVIFVQILKLKKKVKIYSTSDLDLSCAKNRLKKHQIFEKWDYFENGPSCKAYSLWKIVSLAQKFKFQKTCQNLFYKWFRVVLCKKNRVKKHQIFQKWDHFKNGPSCKACSLCKMVTLAQKLKFQKTCQHLFYKWFRIVLCKKTAWKNSKYLRNHTILKMGHHTKPIVSGNRHFGSKTKIPKNRSKSILQEI